MHSKRILNISSFIICDKLLFITSLYEFIIILFFLFFSLSHLIQSKLDEDIINCIFFCYSYLKLFSKFKTDNNLVNILGNSLQSKSFSSLLILPILFINEYIE